eukprot:CAMPEP_0167792236 /NCGR_PEP_ID=MMETSP0111_2-20121227/12448_1 /TAXON_ID=91324 /ORGANISM="Lotharella globosa, Strain CCCM811" /LENGTH=130 /DNA_ID=CAMNT_0007685131 /DNA_START=41 /DNA_END=430 /DNA_ORIENTATION=+
MEGFYGGLLSRLEANKMHLETMTQAFHIKAKNAARRAEVTRMCVGGGRVGGKRDLNHVHFKAFQETMTSTLRMVDSEENKHISTAEKLQKMHVALSKNLEGKGAHAYIEDGGRGQGGRERAAAAAAAAAA